ncbi:MAG: glycosyltransferase family 4 protein [Candidatus Helarchaeota archaeon]
MKNNNQICLAIPPPKLGGGGIYTQIELITKYLNQMKYNFTLFYPRNILQNLFYHEKKLTKLPINSINPPVYHPFYFSNAFFLSFLGSKRFKKFKVLHGIGGTALDSAPFLNCKKKYIISFATLFEDEWIRVFNPVDFSHGFWSWLVGSINNISLHQIKKLEFKILKNATKILPISSYTANILKEKYKIRNEALEILPIPVDTENFQPKKSTNSEEKYLLVVARLDPRKKIQNLFFSFKNLERKYPDLYLYVVGDGSERKKLEFLAKNLNLTEKVKFFGNLRGKKLRTIYQNAELFVLPSIQEGLAVVILEAMACGIPVITTRSGGPEYIIKNRKNGLLIEPNDINALKEAIITLLDDKQLHKKISEEGIHTVKTKFALNVVGKKLLKIYEEVFN